MESGVELTEPEKEQELLTYAEQLCEERLAAYLAAPHDAEEHANIEASVLAGGYAYRQVAELIQNAADAIAEQGKAERGRIVVAETGSGLWAANTGSPVDRAGVRALLNSNTSGKRAGQIGRFGLGFKSLLKLGGRIDVLSRSVCLHFNPELCRARIRAHLGIDGNADAPGLRLAEASSWSHTITMLPEASHFDWATTVVFAELLSPGAREAVADEIRKFPAEFLLFLPSDVELELKANDVDRRLRRRTDSDGCVIIEDLASNTVAPQRWRLFQSAVRITDIAALEDATSVHFRESVPLIWAAPIDAGRETAGRFYAFFPTTTETRTLGILNAPWKLNSDRTALIPGAWNAALMDAAADLIIQHIPELASVEDPGAVLDAFPRELQTVTEPAAPLVEALWRRLTDAKVLPNCDGELMQPIHLHRAPRDTPELIAEWARLAEAEVCETYLHPSCTSSVGRIGRLNQLRDQVSESTESTDDIPALNRTDALKWLELAASSDPDTAAETIVFADMYAKNVPGYVWDQIRDKVRLILTSDGDVAAAPDVILSEKAEPPFRSVHPVLSANMQARQILKNRFDVRDSEETDWLRLFKALISRSETSGDWTDVWTLLRRMPRDNVRKALSGDSVKVRTLNGWMPSNQVFFAGTLVTREEIDSADSDSKAELEALIVDEEWHAADTALLSEMKVSKSLQAIWIDIAPWNLEGSAADWYLSWETRRVSEYHNRLQNRPDRKLLGPENIFMPVGWWLLLVTPDSALGRATAHFLDVIASAENWEFAPIKFKHTSRPASWATHVYPHPLWNLLSERGVLAEGSARLNVSALLNQTMPDPVDLLPCLKKYAQGLEILKRATEGSTATSKTIEIWNQWLDFAANLDADPQSLKMLWSQAAAAGVAPKQVCSSKGPVALTDVRVANSERDVGLANQAGLTAVSLDELTTNIWLRAGARSFDNDMSLEWMPISEDSAVALLIDIEPVLRDILKGNIVDTASVTLTAIMEQLIGGRAYLVDWGISGGQLFVSQDALTACSWPDRLRLLIDAATACGWVEGPDPLERIMSSGVSAKRSAVAAEPDLPRRLIRAVGSVQKIAGLFEQDVCRMLTPDPIRFASVALTLFGPTILAIPIVCEAMLNEGLEPPQRWGTETAADFVAAIGFPPEYASSPSQRREAELAVSGPLPLKPLHDFQIEVVDRLSVLLADTTSKRRRVVISLPTGAGKTRVAAETAVRQVLAPNCANRLVLWIAQTDELCEQAVQCFRELWINIGSQGEALRLVRFWGGQGNPQPAERDEPVVIVASIQTLTSRMNDPRLAWANRPGLIVVDECHHALTSSYTGMLRWLSGDTNSDEREPPIVGLSATPFRGRNEEETLQLARRFDNRLIPDRQAELFDLLQSRGVLAKFDYTRLTIEKHFDLTSEEQEHLNRFQKLPDSALKRLGENAERNDRILEEISVAKEQSALVFGTSVAHAQRLAARLNVMGVPAATVSSETDRSSRRWFIRAFQRGDVRILCNHSALTTGFDAPATDLIVIARPVFSPSLYMQMVGRGLRGPANGGKPKCRIMTVQDNLDEYTGKLAHHYFEKHYVPN